MAEAKTFLQERNKHLSKLPCRRKRKYYNNIDKIVGKTQSLYLGMEMDNISLSNGDSISSKMTINRSMSIYTTQMTLDNNNIQEEPYDNNNKNIKDQITQKLIDKIKMKYNQNQNKPLINIKCFDITDSETNDLFKLENMNEHEKVLLKIAKKIKN